MAFWKWWSTVIIAGTLLAITEIYVDISKYIVDMDPTRLSLLILSIVVLSSLVMGYYSYLVQFRKIKISEQALTPLWYFSDTVLSIGMVGTLVGFLIVLTTTFQNIDQTNAAEIKRIISELANGMGIALITSLTGLISSIIMKFELVMLESENEKI